MSKKDRNYKVIVNGQLKENVLSVIEPIEYYLPAENKEKAITTAKERFGNDYPDAIEINAIINKKPSKVSIICLAVVCFLSLIPYHTSGGSVIYLKPTLIPMLFSFAIYSSVIIRLKGLKNSFNSVLETIGNLLTIIFFASFLLSAF
jgi:hypothetical protein